MITHTSRWSHARGNGMVPSHWQATPQLLALAAQRQQQSAWLGRHA